MGVNKSKLQKTNNIWDQNIVKIFDSKNNIVNNEYERWTNAEIKEMFNEPYTVCVLKSRRLSWVGYVSRAVDRLVNKMEVRSNKTNTAVERQRKSEVHRNQGWRKVSVNSVYLNHS